ncbi:MAG: ABC transporter permease [Anaerolineae bacterium]|nr:ABC transporter permease [Anaerolineae bacterium]
MRWWYFLRRVLLLFLTLWTAATINFFIPKLAPRNPVREKVLQLAQSGGYIEEGIEEMVKAYEEKFGLDQPLWKQYLNYVWDMLHFNLGYSLANYPKTVMELIGESLPWTLGLLSVTVILSFLIGNLLGALIAWPKSPRFLEYLVAPMMTFSAVPYYIFGLVLIYYLAFRAKLFPLGGGYTLGTIPNKSLSFYLDVAYHSILPALSMIIANIGGWALGMRGMMVTVQGEDYMILAEAKGLKPSRIFLRYAVRNALLPQVTSLALSLARVVSGSVLVETVFAYPGIGSLLADAIRQFDYFTIYGIVFMVIVGIGVATLILDLIYPLLDPRIRYEGE